MSDVFKAVRVTDNVYWVGAIDWTVRDFHGYSTRRGTTYNAYLVLADKVTLIDTVKAPFFEEMLERIASVTDPRRIKFLVSNHSEMDHSGSIVETISAIRPERVFASVMGARALAEHFPLPQEVTPVKDGQTVSLGDMNLAFLETRMVHWPDSMFSYLQEEELLFSQDGFGMHLASGERFAEELDPALLEAEAAKYYANILLPLSSFVAKALGRARKAKLPLKIIAPDHGPIWRRQEDIVKIIDCYERWSAQRRTRKAVVVYETMWQSTAKMARAIGEGLAAGGASPRLMPMSGNHRSDVAAEMLDAGALLVGAPTINNTMFPSIADVLTYLKGLAPRGLIGAAFGSYGWSGESIRDISEVLREMGVELIGDGLRVKYVPDDEALARCRQLGEQVAERLKRTLLVEG